MLGSAAMRMLLGSALLAVVLAASAHAAPAPVARAAKTCQPPKYPSSGYFTSLKVTHVSCATGRKLALAYFHCRTKSGLAGRCHRHVMRYACKETRNSIATEIDARVTCRRGSRVIVHTYQQNL
jgi:hypothetical protein